MEWDSGGGGGGNSEESGAHNDTVDDGESERASGEQRRGYFTVLGLLHK